MYLLDHIAQHYRVWTLFSGHFFEKRVKKTRHVEEEGFVPYKKHGDLRIPSKMTRLLLAFLCSAHCTNAVAAPMQTGVFVDFSTPPASTFKTTASYQIVTNPLLDKTYELANGSVIPNPIHDNAWASVKNLNADHVRFQPWFPFPHKVRICT